MFLPTPPATLLQGLANVLSPPSPDPSPYITPTGSETKERDGTTARALRSAANALMIPPLHVDHVAQAACEAIEFPEKVEKVALSASSTSAFPSGKESNAVLGVSEMRELIGWTWSGSEDGLDEGATTGV